MMSIAMLLLTLDVTQEELSYSTCRPQRRARVAAKGKQLERSLCVA